MLQRVATRVCATFLAALVLMVSGLSAPVVAITATTPITYYIHNFAGSLCDVEVTSNGVGGYARVLIPGSAYYFAGGTGFSLVTGSIFTDNALSVASLQGTCGFGHVSNISQNGADGNYWTDGFMGAGFDATMGNARYHFAFGVNGVTGSVASASQTLIASAPTPAITGFGTTIQGRTSVSVDFGEVVTGFSAASVTLTNATLVAGTFTDLGGGKFSFHIRPDGAGLSVSVDIAAGAGTTGFGLTSLAASKTATALAPLPPTSDFSFTPKAGSALPTTAYFYTLASPSPLESITSHAWNFGDGTTSTAPNPVHVYTAAGTYTISYTVCDTSTLCATSTQTITIDNTLGTLTATLSGLSGTITGPTTVTVTLSNRLDPTALGGLTLSDFSTTNLTLSSLTQLSSGPLATSPETWSLIATPVNSGPVSLSLRAGTVQNLSGATNGSVSASATYNQPPVADAGAAQSMASGTTVTLDGTGTTDPNGDTFTYAWTQTDGTAVTLSSTTAAKPTFTAPAVSPTASAVTLTFSLTVTDQWGAAATATTTVTVSPRANAAPVADAGASQSVASGATVTLDGSGTTDPNGDTFTYAWTQTGAGPAVTLKNANTAKPTFTAPTRTATDPTLILRFNLVATDQWGASSAIATTIVRVEGPPSVTISGLPASFDKPTSFDVTITFSKPVTGFAAGDIVVTGGSVTSLSGGSSVYTARVQTSGKGDFTISVPAGAATDTVGNGNTASPTQSVANKIVENTRRQIADFVQQQTASILSTVPDIGDFILEDGGFGTRNLNFAATPDHVTLNFRGSLVTHASTKNYAGKTDVWAQLRAVHTGSGTMQSDSVIGWIGVHRFLRKNLLVGAVLEGDFSAGSDSAGAATGKGRGFMVGPYMAGRLGKSDLRFEVEYLWGKGFNNVNPLGTYTDNYTVQRRLARIKVAGKMVRGKWTIAPNISASYFTALQPAYIDGLGNPVAAQLFTLGEVRFGPEFSRMFTTPAGNVVKGKFGISAITNFSVTNAAASSFPLGNGNLRTRLDIGLSTTTANGWALSGSAFYDGIGTAAYHSYGGTFRASLKF